ncbi:Deaminated glutathione amidase [Thermoflexales bacterium]|nr:Deaminated glutathione amidase [Thermoflexales bacterium]
MSEQVISSQPGTGKIAFPLQDHLSFLWLVVGFVILIFSNGMQIIPIAAWLGPVFMVRFLRTRKAASGLLLGYLVNAVAFYFEWRAAFQDAGAMFTLYTAAFGLLVFLPYVIDRLIRPQIKGFAATLVLPAAWVTVEYLLHLILPLGTFFSIAYTQSLNLPLLQIMSITGLWGVTFLVAWFASVVNYAWEGGFDVRQVGWGVAVYAGILLAVVFLGGLRLALVPPANETVQVAVLVTNVNKEVIPADTSELHQRLIAGTLTPADREGLAQSMTDINNDLLERSRLLAKTGSKIITWTEYNAHVFKDEESVFLDRGRQLAREEHIYLVFPLITIQTDPMLRAEPAQLIENKSVMITPAGEIAYQYIKTKLLIGWEDEHASRGPGHIQAIDTPYGKLTSVICLDMDFPDFMRQAGQQGVDIVLSGAIDGTPDSKGNPLHSVMAAYRTIESGFSLARGGYYGQSVAVDYQGSVLGRNNYYGASDRTLIAHLPVKGTQTVYSLVGDFFPWFCLFGLSGVIVAIIFQK